MINKFFNAMRSLVTPPSAGKQYVHVKDLVETVVKEETAAPKKRKPRAKKPAATTTKKTTTRKPRAKKTS